MLAVGNITYLKEMNHVSANASCRNIFLTAFVSGFGRSRAAGVSKSSPSHPLFLGLEWEIRNKGRGYVEG